jgi:hypothetical protein
LENPQLIPNNEWNRSFLKAFLGWREPVINFGGTEAYSG